MTVPAQTAETLLFFPEKIEEVAPSLKDGITPSLLRRDIEHLDWRVEDLWKVGAYYHLVCSYSLALKYYYQLLQWTEHDDQQHSEVLSAVAHIMMSTGEYADAEKMLRVALKKSQQPGKIPYFLAQVFDALRKYPQEVNAFKLFLEHYPEQNILRRYAASRYFMLLDRMGRSEASEVLETLAQEYASWEWRLLQTTFVPALSFIGETSSEALEAVSKEVEGLSAYLEVSTFHILLSWPVEAWRYHVDPADPVYQHFQHQCYQQAAQRTQYLIAHEFEPVESPLSAAEQEDRVVVVGNFKRPGVAALIPLWISLCRKFSITVMCVGGIPLDFEEEHWMRLIDVHGDLEQLHNAIALQNADTLIYLQDRYDGVGQRFMTTQRLAKRQCLWSTSPVDYVPEAIDQWWNYAATVLSPTTLVTSEQVLLSGTPPAPLIREESLLSRDTFKLDTTKNYYYCPVGIPELHRHFYDWFVEVLRHDPEGILFVEASDTPAGEHRWREFMLKHYPDVVHRCHILPPMPDIARHSLVQHVNVLLDPTYTGLGYLLWELIPLGTPIITCPLGAADWGTALYQHLGWTESCVKDKATYVDQAVALARDPSAKSRCQQAVGHLFDHTRLREQLEGLISSFRRDPITQ